MKILLAYATTDGQTRKVGRFLADHLADAGHAVELLAAADAEGLDPSRFDAAILAGSVHMAAFQKDLAAFAQAQADVLNDMPTLFLPVSLCAAGDDAEDWAGLAECVQAFVDKTGWVPGKVQHVAGAFRFTEYDFFRAWAMRRIADQKGQKVDPHADKEYTDWPALLAGVQDWLAGIGPAKTVVAAG